MTEGRTLTALVPYDRGSPSSRVRVFEWLDRVDPLADVVPFTDRTRSLTALALGQRRRIKFAKKAVECVLLHREGSPFGVGGLERAILERAQHSAYDLDDALMWDFRRVTNLIGPKFRKAASAARAADVVIAGNWVLGEWAAAEARDVRVIPSCVDPDAYEAKASYQLHDPPVVGWLGSASTEWFLSVISEPLRLLHEQCGARLLLVGCPQGDLGALEEIVDRRPWNLQTQATMAEECDVAVMPLDRSAYASGKCGYKLLQYSAMALPTVSSPVGVNAEMIQALGQAAPLSNDEWIGALSEVLHASVARRAELGRNARAAVSAFYSFDVWRQSWTDAVFGTTSRELGIST